MNWILYALKNRVWPIPTVTPFGGTCRWPGTISRNVWSPKMQTWFVTFRFYLKNLYPFEFAHGTTAKLSCNVQNCGSSGSILSHDFIRFVTWIYKYLVMRHPCDCSMLNIIATEFVYNGMKILNIRRMSRQMIHVVRDSEKKRLPGCNATDSRCRSADMSHQLFSIMVTPGIINASNFVLTILFI